MADDIITSVVAGLIIAAVSTAAGILWQQLKTAKAAEAAEQQRAREHDQLVDEALRTLLLCKLEQQQDTMVHDQHGVADNDFKLRANASTTPTTLWAATGTARRSTTTSKTRP